MTWWRQSRGSDERALIRRSPTRLLTAIGAAVAALAGVLGGVRLARARRALAKPAPPEPLGPYAFVFHGSTPVQNTLAGPTGFYGPLASPESGAGGRPPIAGGATRVIEVLVLMVDTSDHRFGGTPAQLQTYRDTKFTALDTQLGPYWLETSFKDVNVALTMRAELLSLRGTFDDYFNRGYIAASLRSSGHAPAGYPLTLTGTATATLHVRDAHGRNVDVVLAPNGTFSDAGQLSAALQTTIDAVPNVPADWVTCTAQLGELHFELAQSEVSEGTFIRVRSGSGHAVLGLDGPLESPGDTAAVASLRGKPVPGGFPVVLAGTEFVEIEVRDKDLKTRRFLVPLAAGLVASPPALASLLLPMINQEFQWAEAFNAGPDRLGLRLFGSFSGPQAAIRVVGGSGLDKLGLDGPRRVDGVIHFDDRLTVRDDAQLTTAEALSLYIARRAQDAGIPVTAAREEDLKTLVQNELGHFESFLVLFVESMTGIPGRRAAGDPLGYYNLAVPGAGGYTFRRQVSTGQMLGTGADGWQTWAHEIGHVLGFWDIYAESYHDSHFDRTFDYVKEWELMNNHRAGAHVGGWHKLKAKWVAPVKGIDKPAAGATETHRFTLAPIEFPFNDYAGSGSASHPLTHLAQINLSKHHWILLENRQPGPSYSQELPDDTVGRWPPLAGDEEGGLFVTDTVDPWTPALYRSAVTTLNPHGMNISRGMKNGDSLDLSTTYPAYDGIVVRVVGRVPGPGGRPEALQVEVEWGPGDFVELEIRNWEVPTYGTHDIWIDWAGNGDENYVGGDPPLGNGDATHWHPDGSVSNRIKVRVHNRGTIEAKDVIIRAKVNTPMGMGGRGTFVPLPDSAPQDIPPDSSRDFVFDWRPREHAHTCLLAEVFTHNSALGDLDLTNNAGQENVTDFHPTAGSPYDPYEFTFKINSDYDQPIAVKLLPSGLPDGMDLEVERPYVQLGPDEEVELRARLLLDETKISPDPGEEPKRYAFSLHAFIATQDAWLPFGGITANVHPGRQSKLLFRSIARDRRTEQIVVNATLQGSHRANQPVDAALVASDGTTYEGTAVTASNGRVAIPVGMPPAGPAKVMIYYLGPAMTGSSAGPLAEQVP
jgi:M6 family metalloprotease-like protein